MPVTYAALTARDRDWSLDAFVDEVNRLLPQVVPGDAGRGKVEVTPRLVRHYATEGVLPRPLKEGVEARYDTDHLVRVLALRRLLAEGYPSAVAGAFLERHDREQLARFLLGGFRVELDLTPAGPPVVDADPTPDPDALERLAALRAKAGLPPLAPPLAAPDADDGGASAPAPMAMSAPVDDVDLPAAATPEGGVAWTRYPLATGLEVHVRDDFVDPETPAAQRTLRDALLARLEAIAVERLTRR